MPQVVDDFGIWDDLGTVIPEPETWLDFPHSTVSRSGTTRLIFGGDLTRPNSYAWIRCVYVIGISQLFGRWIRVYPKIQRDIIEYPHPQDFAGNPGIIYRSFQVQKRAWGRWRVGISQTSLWTLNLQVKSNILATDDMTRQQNALGINLI
jgi:hypothetical protein